MSSDIGKLQRQDLDPGGGPTALEPLARRRLQERLRSVLEAASNGLIVVDLGGRITLANTCAGQIFGCAQTTLVGRMIDELIPELRPSRVVPLHTMRPREVLARRNDGEPFSIEIALSVVDSQGADLLASIVDLSERKRSSDLLRNERAFLRQVIDIDPNLIFAKDREGRFTLANAAVAALYGTTVEGLIGRTDADFNDNAVEIDAFRRDDQQVMDTLQELFIAEEHVTDSTGKSHFLQTVKRPIVGADGIANQVLGVSTDITAYKEAELQLGRQRNELAHLSRVLMVAELSGSIAHELNQPLTAILSNAQAALRFMNEGEAGLAEVREILQDIVEDDKRAGQVIQGLRNLLTKGATKHEPLAVNRLVQDVVRIMRSDLLNAGVIASVELGHDIPLCLGDRVQVQQVLVNLLVNACDAMAGIPRAERRLLISTTLDESHVRVCVGDRGPGIPSELLEKIFEPFFTTKTHGLGIGLAICRSIATAHGGLLSAVSNAGGGTIFCFTLPIATGRP